MDLLRFCPDLSLTRRPEPKPAPRTVNLDLEPAPEPTGPPPPARRRHRLDSKFEWFLDRWTTMSVDDMLEYDDWYRTRWASHLQLVASR